MAKVETDHDYYAILGVSRTADSETIKRRYRILALKKHPDRNKSHNATAEFQLIGEAYKTLFNAETRWKYDRLHPPPKKNGHTAQYPNNSSSRYNAFKNIERLQERLQKLKAMWIQVDDELFERENALYRLQAEINTLDREMDKIYEHHWSCLIRKIYPNSGLKAQYQRDRSNKIELKREQESLLKELYTSLASVEEEIFEIYEELKFRFREAEDSEKKERKAKEQDRRQGEREARMAKEAKKQENRAAHRERDRAKEKSKEEKPQKARPTKQTRKQEDVTRTEERASAKAGKQQHKINENAKAEGRRRNADGAERPSGRSHMNEDVFSNVCRRHRWWPKFIATLSCSHPGMTSPPIAYICPGCNEVLKACPLCLEVYERRNPHELLE